MITIQYLEPGPHIAEISPSQARAKLQAAFDILPIDCLLLGWEIPAALEDICRELTASAGARFYRWHPLLTDDGIFLPEEGWRTRNLDGLSLPGFRNLPEFTFVCPNNPDVREVILTHVAVLAQSGRYDGIFLDRMRFPSPAPDPLNALTCFCKECQRAADSYGLDLEAVFRTMKKIPKLGILKALCGEEIGALSAFLNFRQNSITQFITEVVKTIRASALEIGLDCFSPTLTRMVGQDLSMLAPLADWTKIMIYGYAFGPATLPFELTSLVNWLIKTQEVGESEILTTLATITNFALPNWDPSSSQISKLPPDALAAEYERGQQMIDCSKLLAGIELVEIPGVCELNEAQIEADLSAYKLLGADGLALSWDLWRIPNQRLKLVNSIWFL